MQLVFNRTILRHEGFHKTPRDEICHATETEHDKIACGLTRKTKELERLASRLRIGEETTCALLDNHRTDTTRHSTDTGDGGDAGFREHVSYG